MRTLKATVLAFVSAILLVGVLASPGSTGAFEEGKEPGNAMCLGCHGFEGFAVPAGDRGVRQLHVSPDKFGKSVHGKRSCLECHKDIIQIPHRKQVGRKVGCVQCHQNLWETAQKEGKAQEFHRLGEVVQQIDSYMGSIHARPSMEDQSHTNATCYDCHNAHYIYPIDSRIGVASRLNIPNVCGKCHTEQRDAYLLSVHGKEVSQHANANAAVCIDCHTTHDIESPKADPVRLLITKNCGSCHVSQLKTYMGTYHGQVNTLGYAHTAKCFDCHGHHGIQRVNDEASTVHEANRLQTCQKCHEDATAGFVTFLPHGNTHDLERYPAMWIASKFMILLLAGVFAFFWTHAALWFHREHKDRKQGKNKPHVQMDKLPPAEGKYFRRFGRIWRLAHLMLALAVMTLVLTGTAVLYAGSFWAPVVIELLGGVKAAAILHRIAALTFIAIFFGHLIYFAVRIVRSWKTFRWFGPESLLPNWQDFRDAAAMFRWFFSKGPRPIFDRWTYYEKFDYWAPFWGMFIIGVSGVMMWFPAATASVFPGWVFNVATIIHGEEAFLAAVFLFTVHFFNCHFRPDKFPQDIVMFTGAVPLEEYRREHTLEYKRLIDSGELEKCLVDAPSRPMTLSSKILGASLITIGLMLLMLVLLGFWGNVLFG